MKRTRVLFVFLLILSSFCWSIHLRSQVNWTGQGDGINWSDANNWSTNALPTSTDTVLIGGDTSKVQFNIASATILALWVVDSAKLTFTSGNLTIDNQNRCSAIVMSNQDTMVVDVGSNLTIINAMGGMEIIDGTSYLFNAGTITFGPNIQYDAIWVNFDGRLHLFNETTGTIQTNYAGGAPNEGAFIFVDNFSAGYSTFTNEGMMQGTAIAISAFIFGAPANIYNSGTMDFQFIQQFPVFDLNFGSLLHNQNTGTLNISNYDDTGINLDFQSTCVNDGIITLTDDAGLGITASEAIDLDDANSTFKNTGTITIVGNEQSESIELDGSFENSGFLNVGNASAFESIKVRSGGNFTNTACGVVNITTSHLIGNSGTFTNDGILTTVFTGTNLNLGLFTNNNIISTTDGLFNVTPNPIVSTGMINTGPIPAITSQCNLTCPVLRNVLVVHSVGDTLLQASDSIITVGTVQINNTQTVDYHAATSIILSPGFSASVGSNFSAKIASCQQNSVNALGEMPIAALRIQQTTVDKPTLKIFPNPLKYDGQAEFYLPTDQTLNISLWNGVGQRLQVLHQHQTLSKGIHQMRLPVSGLESGIYFLRLTTSNNEINLVQKLMIME